MAGATSVHEIAQRIADSGKVETADVLAVRRAVYGGDCLVSGAEAEAVFAVERARRVASPEWSAFFVEALSDYILNQAEPRGFVSEDNAAWLQGQISKRRTPSMDGDLAILVRVIEEAREVPPAFAAFALRTAKEAAIYGDGADAQGRAHVSGRVDQADVAMLQRILWGAGSEGHLAVSREEAEALFAIADATTGAANDPAFDDLFAKAIGNYLLGATGRVMPDRETALRFDNAGAYKADVVGAMGNVLGHVFGKRPPKLTAMLKTRASTLAQEIEDEHGQRNMERDVAIEMAAILTPEKAGWLQERIARNGVTNGPEKALLAFVERESVKLGADSGFELAKAG